jgi:hypothetical protein
MESIKELSKDGATVAEVVDTVAEILEQETQSTIADWLQRVSEDTLLMSIAMPYKTRSAHLPDLFKELVLRLRYPLELGTHAMASRAAVKHGRKRRKQGYTAAMMVEESRMLQVSIFQTLQTHVHRLDASLTLIAVMAIADEVDSQLAQAMTIFVAESKTDGLPVNA